ncbi:MAG: serine hydrolase, partial [Pedobacter sp.]|nr:serine hydrolase [Pedobacter sp.]
MKKLAIILLICISSLSGFAQQFNGKKLDSLFQKLDEHQKWMGSFALSLNGIPVYTKAIGFSDSEALKKSTSASKYRIGSISKTFTAVLIFKAIEAKYLLLNDKLA